MPDFLHRNHKLLKIYFYKPFTSHLHMLVSIYVIIIYHIEIRVNIESPLSCITTLWKSELCAYICKVRRPIMRLVRGNPGIPYLPQHFQHGDGCLHKELGDASNRGGILPSWFRTGQWITAFIYAYARILDPPQPARLQADLDVFKGLFYRVGLLTNVNKTLGVVFQPCWMVGGHSEAAYQQQVMGAGL